VNIETGPKLREHRHQQTFGEDVGILGRSGNVQDTDFTKGDSLSDEVQVDLNMLGSLMLNRISGEINGADIITVDHCSTTERTAKLCQELAQPASFGDSIHDSSIFCLCTRLGHCRLTLGRPRDEIVPEKHRITRGGFTCIRATCPICIGVDSEVNWRGPVKVQSEVQGTLKVPENALQSA
jgi:hypothetical protein